MNAHLSLCALLCAVGKKRTVFTLSHKNARELIMKKGSSMPRAAPLLSSLSPFFLPFVILSVSSLSLFTVLVIVLHLYFPSWGTEASEGREWAQQGKNRKKAGWASEWERSWHLHSLTVTLGKPPTSLGSVFLSPVGNTHPAGLS